MMKYIKDIRVSYTANFVIETIETIFLYDINKTERWMIKLEKLFIVDEKELKANLYGRRKHFIRGNNHLTRCFS